MKRSVGCIHCRPCNILCGIGGAGLFSDGKLNFIHKLGKTDLTQFLPTAEACRLIDETEAIFNRFGMDGPVYPTDLEKARAGSARRRGKTASTYCLSGRSISAATICPGISRPWPDHRGGGGLSPLWRRSGIFSWIRAG
jgi:hypothetical protein